MGSDTARAVLYRFALPVTLLAACIVRYNGLSVIYLICLLVIPLLPSPSRRAACAVKLQQAILGLSAIAIAAHISFQISLIAEKSFASQIGNCSFAEQISRQFGFNKFQRGDTVNVIRLLAPDVLVFIVSLVCVIGSRKVRAHAGSHSRMHRDSDATAVEDVLPVFVALMLLLGGIVQPNVISSVYFLVFLFLGTFWACHRSIRFKKNKGFFCLKMLLTVYSAIHVVLLYLYQIEFFQSLLASSSLYARLLGLPAIVESQCGYGNDLNINRRLNWPVYVYPVVIFLVYWILATEVRYKCSKKYEQSRTARQPFLWWNPLTWKDNPNESEHLLSEGDRRYSYRTFRGSPRVQPELPALQTEQPVEPISVQGTFSSIVMFLMRQNYIAALIVMMAWSITYHSWLTFVLLLWACLTWITPFARWFCMVSSPYLVIYAECLLIIQYIYGMNLNDEELPVKQGKLDYSELGLKKFDYPCLHLGAQTLFTWIFWITLRQHVRERKLRRRQVGETGELMLTTLARPIVQAFKKRSSGHPAERRFRGPESDIDDIDAGPPSDDAKEFMQWIRSTLAKYWILVCCAAFLLVALQKDVSLYQIFYMVTFLFGFIVYQFSVKVWKIVLRPLWWFMVIYSILILLIVYTYQFKNMHRYWKEGAGIKEDMLHDLGLRQHDKASLLVELLIPTLFSIALVIQLHFFHKPLTMKINHLIIHRKQSKQRETLSAALQKNPEESETETTHAKKSPPEIIAPESAPKSDSEPDTEAEGELTTLHKFLLFYKHSSRVLWRVAEIHMLKVISFVVMLVVVQQVSAFNAVLLLVLSVSMPSQRLQRMMNYFFVVWASIVVFGLMFYQLRFVNEDVLKYNCTAQGIVKPIPVMVGHFSSNARWMGLHKSSKVSVEVRGYLFIVLAIVFAKVVKHHQELYKFKKGIRMQPGVLFEGVTRSMADESIKNCIKYMCNNFFNCFGFEMNLMIMVICIAARCDAFAVLESLWIATFLFIRRKSSERLWPFYIGYLCIFLPLQYLLILGWPPGLCLNYPWTGHLSSNLVRWLYLTDVSKPQNQFVLLADFFQLLFACCQENCFANERRQRMESARSSLSTGTHLRPKSIKAAHSSHASTRSDHYIPADFMVNKTWLDFLKIVVLEQLYWLTLSIVYITAQTAASIFNAGFLLACFFFLWHGQSLYLRPKHTLRRWWKIFIGYNFLVIILKVWLQVASCVYIDKIKRRQKTGCVLIQLLNLYCLRQKEYAPPIYRTDDPNCLSEANTGLAVDAVCFVFAIIQYRIFKSIYFKYVIREHKKQSDMATRGAQLVEQRLNARLQESNEKDRKKMEEIKASVAKLKQKQEDLNPTQEEPLSHYEAIYSGDYYWYESDDEEVDKSKVVSKTSLPVITTVPPSVSSEEATPSPRSTEVTSPELPSRPSTSSSVEVEASSSSRSTNIESPSRSTNIESPSSSIRHRKKQKSPTDMSLTSSVSLIDLDVEYEETQETTNVTSEKTEEKQRTCMDSVREFGATCKKYFEDIANSMIDYFNEISADYRAIAEQLEREWTVKFKEHIKIVQQRRASREPQEGTSSDVERITSADKSNSGGSSSGNQEDDSDTWSFITVDEDQTDGWQKQDSVGVRFSVAFYYALLANTDLLCYALMIVNHMYYASMLSIPLPFFVVLWGMLSIPRPTKRFWIAIITYVELVIVVKYVFQFQFIMYNDCSYYENEKNNPLCPPRIIGIERGANSTVCDLLLLLGLFFHRFALKVHGLWREKAWQEEEDGSQHQRSPTFDETQTLEPVPVLDYNASSERSAAGKPQDTTLTPSSESTRSSERERRSVLSNIKRFIERMLDPGVGTGAVDVYAWMFGCQFIVFLIIIFNWSAFSSPESSKRNFAQIIEENVVPRTFLYMLLTQFILIMIDRYLYLRKLVFVKLLYMALLVFSFHIFMFLAVPLITTKKFIDNIPAIFMYVFQCMYFGLSAYQVRCGYPIRILGNFLTKSYTLTSGMLFQGIQSIPFLLELRSVLDWVCTDTTLSLSHWLKMEDIYANIYILKCWRDSEKTWPHPRGMKYWASSKILLGGLLIFLLIVVIWFPLLFMSFINSAFISNIPVDVTFTLSVGGYQPLFKMSAQQQFLHRLENWEIDQMSSSKGLAKTKGWDEMKAKAFFDDYKKKGNIVRIKVLSNSSAVWAISPPSRQFLIKELQSNASISIRFKYEFSREPNTSQAALVQETVSGAHVIPLKPYGKIRRDLRRILQSDKDGGEMVIKNLFPTFIQVPASGPAKAVQQLGEGRYVKCILKLRKGQVPQLNASQVEWWEIIQDTKQVFPMKDSLEIITFNDLVPPLHLSFFASKGIIGLYVGFVWLIGKFVRLFFSSISYRIMFDEMPNVNKVLKLCLGIYMVRESKEFKLEEDLFAKLLFLYRSPMTLIKWTKYKRM